MTSSPLSPAPDSGSVTLTERQKDVVALLAVAAIAVVFFWRFLFLGHIPINGDWLLKHFQPWQPVYENLRVQNMELDDPIILHYPLWLAGRQMLRAGVPPIWNPYIFCGSPLLADSMCHPFDPLNLATLFLPEMQAWGYVLFFSFLIAGIAFYLYLRELRLGRAGAFVGAACYMLNGFFAVWAEYRFVVGLFCWMPIALIALERVIKGRSLAWALMGGVALGFCVLAGNLHFVVIAGFFLLLYGAWRVRSVAYEQGQAATLRALSACGIMVAVGAGLSAIQWLPTLEIMPLSQRNLQKYETANWLYPLELVALAIPKFFGHPADGSFSGQPLFQRTFVAMSTPYVGVAGLMLAGVGLAAWRRTAWARFYGALVLGVIAFLFLLNAQATHFVLNLIAPINTLDHHRLFVLCAIGLAALAGIGMHTLRKQDGPESDPQTGRKTFLALRVSAIVVLAIAGALILLSAILLYWRGQEAELLKQRNIFGYLFFLCSRFGTPLRSPQILPSLLVLVITGGLGLAWSLSAVRRKAGNLIACAVVSLLVADLLYFGMQYSPFVPPSLVYPKNEVAEFLRSRMEGSLVRFSGVDTPRDNPRDSWKNWKGDCFPPATAIGYGLTDLRGKDGFYPERTRKFMERINRDPYVSFEACVHFSRWKSKLLDLLGMRYVVSRDEINDPAFTCVFEGPPRVYENALALPRAFVVHKARVVLKRPDMDKLLYYEAFDPAQEVLLEEEPYGFPLETKAPAASSAKVVEYSPTRVVVETELTAPGFLVLTDTYCPGWSVTVDGVRARLMTANFLLRCVPVPQGRHRVEFRYSPWSFLVGSCLSVLTLLAVPALFFCWRGER